MSVPKLTGKYQTVRAHLGLAPVAEPLRSSVSIRQDVEATRKQLEGAIAQAAIETTAAGMAAQMKEARHQIHILEGQLKLELEALAREADADEQKAGA